LVTSWVVSGTAAWATGLEGRPVVAQCCVRRYRASPAIADSARSERLLETARVDSSRRCSGEAGDRLAAGRLQRAPEPATCCPKTAWRPAGRSRP